MFGSLRRFETITAFLAIAALALGCILVLRPFLSALLWAAIVTFATWPLYVRLERALNHHRSVAALLMTVMLALGFVVPLFFLGSAIAQTATDAVDFIRGLLSDGPPAPPPWIAALPVVGPELETFWRRLAQDTGEFAELLKSQLIELRYWAIGSGLAIGKAIAEVSLSVFAAFFFYRDGIAMVDQVGVVGHRLLGDRAQHLVAVTASTVRGVVYGVIGTALVQGLCAWVGFILAGVPAAFSLGFLTFILGLVPAGPPMVWIPATIWLFLDGQIGWSIFLALWGFFVVSGVDNVLKPYLISRESKLPLLLVFLGVLGGALAFGVIGIFLGPTLLAVGYALLRDWTEAARGRGLAAAPTVLAEQLPPPN